MVDTSLLWRRRDVLAAGIFAAGLAAGAGRGHAQGGNAASELNIHLSQLTGVNNATKSGYDVMIIGAQLFVSLVKFTKPGSWEPEPYLAQSWTVADDRKSYTFKLAPDAIFHDGKPVTARDVVFSVNAVKKYHPFGTQMYGAVTEVVADDDHTVTIKLSAPNEGLFLALAPHLTPIMPDHVFGEGELTDDPLLQKPIGSGPFKFVSFTPNETAVLEKFDGFFMSDEVKLDRLKFALVTDANVAGIAMDRGEIDVSPFSQMSYSTLRRLKNNTDIVITDAGHEGIGAMYYLEMNLRKPPFDNPKVREAVAYAVDRNFITSQLQQGFAEPAYGPISARNKYYSQHLNHYDLDLEKANRLLDEAGFPMKDDGTRFEVRIDWIPVNRDRYQTVAEYMKPQLKKIGISVVLRPASDFATWAKRIAEWDFDMQMTSSLNWGEPTIGVHRLFLSSNIKHQIFTNTAGYSNAEVDKLLGEAAVEGDTAKRKQEYEEFQKIVNRDLPMVFLFEAPPQTVFNKNIHDLPLGIWGTICPFLGTRKEAAG